MSVVGKLVALEAAVLWTPDGEPPPDWSRERSADIYRTLLVTLRVSPRKVASAIWGLAAIIRAGEIDWLRGKATARCFYHTHHGPLDLLNEASDRYYFEEARRKGRLTGFQRDRELTKIGDLV